MFASVFSFVFCFLSNDKLSLTIESALFLMIISLKIPGLGCWGGCLILVFGLLYLICENRSVAIGTKLHEFVIPCLNKYKPDLIKETFLTS